MERLIHTHKVRSDEALSVRSLDDPGLGGAHHYYCISGEHWNQPLLFQKGPIQECGVNGVTHEALLAVVIDRLRAFQAGPFSCRENALALTNIEQGLMWLQQRTREREARGVEGRSQP